MEDIGKNVEYTFIRESDAPDEIQEVLSDGEEVVACYKTVRDYAVFTNKRIIFGDKQGLTGKKIELYTIPFKAILMYSTENARGFLDTGELQILTKFSRIKLNLKKKVDVRQLDKIIANHIL
ncbi:MAG: PH domain-containing protein [Candidatus Izimaplasma sp.]|nr:PH domain-containing protein [Candidatus Izimaplasma bacterium]